MKKQEQRRFVRELLDGIKKELLASSHKWPEEWDGHELRALIEEAATASNAYACASPAGISIYPARRHCVDRARRKAFENECVTRNII